MLIHRIKHEESNQGGHAAMQVALDVDGQRTTRTFRRVSCAGALIAVCCQKCLAARSPSRTVPETAHTATILIRFCVATDIVDAA